nr:hypothetical protein [Mucispirillum sp.]
IITIINGCAASNFTENQIYKSKQEYKCDIIIDNLYTKDNLSFSTFADGSDYFMLSLLKLLENNIQLEFSNIDILFLPVKDNITGTACFETNSSKVYADIINGVIHGNIVENNKTNGRLTSTCEVNNGKVDTYTHYVGDNQYSIDYEFKTISFYHKNHMVLYTDLEENTAEYYYDNGNISKEVKFKDGVLDGIARYYFESGALQEERHYKNGIRNGNAERYSEKGALWATITYKNDKPVSGICGNGRKWTKAELINWENGVAVTCEYQ